MPLNPVLAAGLVWAHWAREGLLVQVRPYVPPHPVLLVAVIIAVLALVPHFKVLQLDVHRAAELIVGAAPARRLRHRTLGLFGLFLLPEIICK